MQDQGRAMLVIDTNAPGVVIERRFDSLDGSHHAAFRFDNVLVPADHVIGRPGEGLPRAMRQIGDTRLLIAAEAVGLARWAIEFTTRPSARRRIIPANRSAHAKACGCAMPICGFVRSPRAACCIAPRASAKPARTSSTK